MIMTTGGGCVVQVKVCSSSRCATTTRRQNRSTDRVIQGSKVSVDVEIGVSEKVTDL